MKIIYIVIVIMMVCLACVGCTEKAQQAQEPPDSKESEWSVYFYDNWLDKLVTMLGVAAGIITAVSVTIYKSTSLMKNIKVGLSTVERQQKDLANTDDNLTKSKKKCEEAEEALKVAFEQNKELTSNCKLLQKQTIEYFNRIKKILALGFLNNGELVKKGYAAEISKLLEEEQNMPVQKSINEDAYEVDS